MKTKTLKIITALTAILITLSTFGATSIKWTFATGGKVISSPVLLNGIIYVGSLDGNFYALNSETGTEIWRFESGNQIRTIPVMYNNEIICFESGNTLFAIDFKGNQLWTTQLYDGTVINEHDQWDCFRSSPTLNDTVVYIGSELGKVLGINIKTGEIVFSVQTPQANATIETTPLIYKNKIFVGDWLGVFSVFDLTTGDLTWQYDTKEDNTYDWVNAIVSKPLIYNNTIYFGGRNCNLYAFNPDTGEKKWMYHSPEDKWLFGGPVVNDNVLYVGSSYQEKLYAFNPDQPELLWQTFVGGLNYGDPSVTNDYVVIGTGGTNSTGLGTLSVLDKTTHKLVAKLKLNGWVETPLVDNGIVYFGCGDNNVYAVVLNDLVNHVGIPENTPESGFNIEKIYPNPTDGQINLTLNLPDEGQLHMRLLNLQGKEVKTLIKKNVLPGKYEFQLNDPDISSGMYLCELRLNDDSIFEKLVVK